MADTLLTTLRTTLLVRAGGRGRRACGEAPKRPCHRRLRSVRLAACSTAAQGGRSRAGRRGARVPLRRRVFTGGSATLPCALRKKKRRAYELADDEGQAQILGLCGTRLAQVLSPDRVAAGKRGELLRYSQRTREQTVMMPMFTRISAHTHTYTTLYGTVRYRRPTTRCLWCSLSPLQWEDVKVSIALVPPGPGLLARSSAGSPIKRSSSSGACIALTSSGDWYQHGRNVDQQAVQVYGYKFSIARLCVFLLLT